MRSGWTFGRPMRSGMSLGVTVTFCVAPSAILRATLRPSLPISRSSWRTPAVLAVLAQHEIALGDLELLALGVAREVHRLEPVEQRPRNALQEVGGRDEQHLR